MALARKASAKVPGGDVTRKKGEYMGSKEDSFLHGKIKHGFLLRFSLPEANLDREEFVVPASLCVPLPRHEFQFLAKGNEEKTNAFRLK